MPVPVKLTDEVVAAVPLWRELGLSTNEIAEMLGVVPGSIRVACHHAGVSARGHQTSAGLKRVLTEDQWTRLSREADVRHIPIMQLAAAVIGAVADDELFAAVLDDDEPPQPGQPE